MTRREARRILLDSLSPNRFLLSRKHPTWSTDKPDYCDRWWDQDVDVEIVPGEPYSGAAAFYKDVAGLWAQGDL